MASGYPSSGFANPVFATSEDEPRKPPAISWRMDAPVLTLGFTLATFVLAGFVKGVIGIGLPTVAMGLLAMMATPAEAASLVVVPSFVTNVWQLAVGPGLAPLLRRLWPMLLGTCAGAAAGAGLLAGAQSARPTVALGVALVLYAALGLTSVAFSVPARAEPWLSPLVGAATGIVTAATGVYVIPAVPYLQALGLDKDELVQACGLSFTVSTVALAGVLAHDGVLDTSVAGASLLALAPALAGMALGQWVRSRPELFRLCFLAALLGLGAHLAVRGLL
jgi:uncharacterized protein